METYISPNMPEIVGADDSASIQNAVDTALRTGVRRVVIPRRNERTGEDRWDIARAIILGSDMEIVLDNCWLRMMDGTVDNMFRNYRFVEDCNTIETQMYGIHIRGQGNARIDGGEPNGLLEAIWDGKSKALSVENNLILFFNLRDFSIEHLRIENSRFWAVNLVHAQEGRLADLHIQGECDQPCQDGIDLRIGCHDIIMEDLRGQAGDDFIALSAISGSTADYFRVEGRDEDIHDIMIHHICATSVECAVIALRTSDGRKIYHVHIDDIHDTDNGKIPDADYPKHKINPMNIRRYNIGNAPYTLLRIGQNGYYKKRCNLPEEITGITATNLYARYNCAIMLNVGLSNSYFGNVYGKDGVDYLVTTKSGRPSQIWGANLKNVVFENFFLDNQTNDFATAFDFDTNTEPAHLENVFIHRAFLGNCRTPFHMNSDGKFVFDEVYGANVEQKSGSMEK